ncbi:MAG TPA: tetratricopeptide repeat protein [Gemmataceae bacterium]|nr:tetratricopeptide repeat protein [Gemmataceae bacterium]
MVSESVENLCHKARQAVAQGNYEEARQLYLQALGLKADSPDVHYGLATVCFLLNELPNAAYHFKEVTRLDPLRAGAYINLGAVYNRLDQVDEAIQVLRRGIQLDTHRAEGYYNLGLAYRRKKQTDLAIQAYHEATRLNPRMPDAHLNLANAYLDKGQYGQAMSHYKLSLEIRPNWEKAQHGLQQAEAALEAARQSPAETSAGGGAAVKEKQQAGAATNVAVLDPERTVDPNTQGALLTNMHRATIESENHGRNFLQVLEREVEPAIKELSSCLLYPDSSLAELDECVKKFEAAMQSIRSAQRSLQSSMEQVRLTGERLINS